MKISIAIPSRERAQYLAYSLKTALDIDDPDIEIVVSDNASRDNTAEVVAAFDDPRIVYTRSESRLSMRENFNRAFHASSGDYVIFFGDDDAILPGQFKYLRAMLEENKPDGISWNRPTYAWPVPGSSRRSGGLRFYRENCFGKPVAYESSHCLPELLASRLTALTPMPDIYHGCISRAYMKRISVDEANVFDSSIPDFNVCYRAVLLGGNFVHTNHSFSINGYGSASTGAGQSAAQKSGGNTGTSQQFEQENKADPLADVLGYASSVPLAFFSTLETIRHRHGLTQHQPDYLAWYRYVLSSARKNPELKHELIGILTTHAKSTDSIDVLNRANELPFLPKRTFAERLKKWRSVLHSFRISAEVGGENNVYSAAKAMDHVLGDGFERVHSGRSSASVEWSAAKRRSKQFKRLL